MGVCLVCFSFLWSGRFPAVKWCGCSAVARMGDRPPNQWCVEDCLLRDQPLQDRLKRPATYWECRQKLLGLRTVEQVHSLAAMPCVCLCFIGYSLLLRGYMLGVCVSVCVCLCVCVGGDRVRAHVSPLLVWNKILLPLCVRICGPFFSCA